MLGFTEELTDTDFKLIASIAADLAGLSIPHSKKTLVQSRISRRMRELSIPQKEDYLKSLQNDEKERSALINVLTTNVSHFFREPHHFKLIQEKILSRTDTYNLRFWSAGCSNGQEPYSLAYEVLKSIPDAREKNILILASDIDQNVLAKAKSGIYSASEIEGVPQEIRPQMFDQIDEMQFQIKKSLRNLVRFRSLNLNQNWPMKRQFHLVLCRNVVIYFNAATQNKLWPRFADQLLPGGLLMLGHSERIQPLEGSGFENIDITTYRKL